jgi:hypothetical protein
MTGYRRRFLEFLPRDADWARNRESAEVVSRIDKAGIHG